MSNWNEIWANLSDIWVTFCFKFTLLKIKSLSIEMKSSFMASFMLWHTNRLIVVVAVANISERRWHKNKTQYKWKAGIQFCPQMAKLLVISKLFFVHVLFRFLFMQFNHSESGTCLKGLKWTFFVLAPLVFPSNKIEFLWKLPIYGKRRKAEKESI